MRFQLLELILADQVPTTVTAHIGRSTGRSPAPLLASSGQEWHFHLHTLELILADIYCHLYC